MKALLSAVFGEGRLKSYKHADAYEVVWLGSRERHFAVGDTLVEALTNLMIYARARLPGEVERIEERRANLEKRAKELSRWAH